MGVLHPVGLAILLVAAMIPAAAGTQVVPPCSEDDAGDHFGDATPLGLPAHCEGGLHSADEDWYRVELRIGQSVSVSVVGEGAEVCLYAADGRLEGCGRSTGALSHSTGPHRVEVHGAPGTYTLVAEASSDPQWSAEGADCDLGRDAADARQDAEGVAFPSTCSGHLASGDPADWYAFSVPPETVVVASIDVDGDWVRGCLVDEVGREAFCKDLDGTTWLTAISYGGGKWSVVVKNLDSWLFLGTEKSYTARVYGLLPQDACGDRDASPTYGRATEISVPAECVGRLGARDVADWYTVDAAAGDRLVLEVNPHGDDDFDLCLASPGGSVFACSRGGAGSNESLTYDATSSGAWGMLVQHRQGLGNYTFRARVEPAPQDDCGMGADAGATETTAMPIAPDARCRATLTGADTVDHFEVHVPAGTRVHARFDFVGFGNAKVCLFNADMTDGGCAYSQYTWSEAQAGYPADHAVVDGDSATAQTWFVKVVRLDGVFDYDLSLWTTAVIYHDDCDTGTDAGDDLRHPTVVEAPVACEGDFLDGDLQDVYGVRLTAPTGIDVEVARIDGGKVLLCLHAPDGRQAECREGEGSQRIQGTTLAPGTWTLRIQYVDEASAYRLSLETGPPVV